MDRSCIVYQKFSLIFTAGDHNRSYFAHASAQLDLSGTECSAGIAHTAVKGVIVLSQANI